MRAWKSLMRVGVPPARTLPPPPSQLSASMDVAHARTKTRENQTREPDAQLRAVPLSERGLPFSLRVLPPSLRAALSAAAALRTALRVASYAALRAALCNSARGRPAHKAGPVTLGLHGQGGKLYCC